MNNVISDDRFLKQIFLFILLYYITFAQVTLDLYPNSFSLSIYAPI